MNKKFIIGGIFLLVLMAVLFFVITKKSGQSVSNPSMDGNSPNNFGSLKTKRDISNFAKATFSPIFIKESNPVEQSSGELMSSWDTNDNAHIDISIQNKNSIPIKKTALITTASQM